MKPRTTQLTRLIRLFTLSLLLLLTLVPASTAQPAPLGAPGAPTVQAQLPQSAPPQAQQAALPPGGFIQVAGSQLTRFGQPVRIKGVNYYPQGRPWAEMWQVWKAPQMAHELEVARDQLGINALRVLLPYDAAGPGQVNNKLLKKLRELLQIAGDLDMRVIITLFDFNDNFPRAGTDTADKHVDYMGRIIGNFAGDERILAWDIHNEPDHYPTWQNGGAQEVLDWLGRMADEAKRLAPNHLITVGMGQYDNLWQPGPDGRRVVDYSDVISMHNYNAADMARQLDEIRKHTWKPILLGEFGWPTGPECVVQGYDEAQQAWVYQEALRAAEGRVAGIFAWTLRDYHAGPTMRWDSREEYYGLYRPDGSLKPAAQTFQAYAAEPLPATTRTDLQLSDAYHRISGEQAPVFIEEGGHYVKDWFRRAWEWMGGQGSFGAPLSEAYIRPSDGRVVQHFTAAVLEYYPEAMYAPTFELLPTPQSKTMELIRPASIGRTYTAGRTFPPQPPVTPGPDNRLFPETGYVVQGQFLTFYDTFLGPWRLGNPLSPEVIEVINDVPITMQYFERGRLEWSPQTNAVQFGQIGLRLWERQCRFEGE